MASSSTSSSAAVDVDVAVAVAAAASASASFKYDVFLSFRGKDTRYTFTDHLCKALRAKGIETFMDDQLRRGELITPALVTAIEGSRHSVIVLSENYASSKWCLDELMKILQTQNTKGRRAVPIFYNVNPSDVGNQRGGFGTALADHEEKLKSDHEKKLRYDMERVQGWRKALTQVGKISGFTSSRDRPETQFIEEIITDISKDLNCVSSSDVENLVGMNCCIRDLELKLCLESIEVHMVGIWGMGGIGKTTLARVIYERLFHQFEGCCFLEDLKSKRMKNLKAELLSEVLGDKDTNMRNTSIKAKLHSKKVLIVIDDVTHPDMLETLVGEHGWFGPGSRIIITTRDKHLLTLHGVEENAIYEVKKLEPDNAIKLFSHYAFKNKPPSEVVINLLHQIISYAQGLPLALKVLGCSLCDRNEDYWIDKLILLKKFPSKKIQKVLQITFDELEDNEKGIFLDIACFFRRDDETSVRKILGSCGFNAVSGIENLIDKSLITITRDGRLEMHDLLQEMGWQIVRKASPTKPGKRSRLWEHKDISHVLKWETGAKEVEGISLDLCELVEMNFTTKAFSRMTNLRLLKIYRSNLWDTWGNRQCKLHISDDFKFHYDELSYLHWVEYPCESLPSDFESKNLAYFYMPHSHLTQLWEGQKAFGNLKSVDVSYSQYLKETPDFSRATNLEVLVLKGCTNLREIHPSLEYLSKLILLNLENCRNLEHLPSICRYATNIEVLVLKECTNLREIHPSLEYSSKLILLNLENCINLEHLPCICRDTTNLKELVLKGCTNLRTIQPPLGYLSKLILLNLENCRNLEHLPSICRYATNLEVLVLKGCTNLREIHPSLEYLSKLILLNLESCINLEHLPSIRGSVSLQTLILSGCSKLKKLPEFPQHMPYLSKLHLDGTAITDLSGWSELGNFQENSGNLDCLDEFNSDDSTIRQLPSSSVVPRNHNASLSTVPRSSYFISPHRTLTALKDLNLSGTPIIHLPGNLERLSRLQKLKLTNCGRLQALPVLPSSMRILNASNCTSLEFTSPLSVFKGHGGLLFGNCFKLREYQSQMEHDVQSVASHVDPARWRSYYNNMHPHVDISFSTVFPGSEIPDWFRHHSQGHQINIETPPDWYINSNFLGFALSVVMTPQRGSWGWFMYCDLDTHDLNSNSHRICSFASTWSTYEFFRTPIKSDHIWLAYVPSFFSFSRKKWSHIKFSFSSDGGCVVKSCGVCPVYIKGTSDDGDYSDGSALDDPNDSVLQRCHNHQ